MSIAMQIRVVAGVFILLSLALAQFHSHNWLLFTAFVGLNLIQSAFTNFCPAETILVKINKFMRTRGHAIKD